MRLVDKSGKTVDVPDEQAAEAFASGQYGVPKGQDVHVVGEDGTVGSVAPEHLQEVLSGGGRLASQQEYRGAELEAKYGGVGGHLAAAGEGLARGATLGLSDPLAVGAARMFGGDEAAEKTRTHLAEEKEAHPWLSIGSEVLGAVAPIALSGGAAAPEAAAVEGAGLLGRGARAGVEGVKALGAIPRLASGIGDVAEHAAGLVFGEGAETALGKAAQGAAKAAARGIAEGGIFGAGAETSNATLQNEPLTAEKLVTAVGHGALTAGALGAGLGAAGSLAKTGLGRLLEHVSPKLEDAAAEQTWKWLDPPKRLSEEASARAGGTAAVGRTVFERVVRPLVEEQGWTAAALDHEGRLELVQKAIGGIGKEIEGVVQGNPKAMVKIADVLEPIDTRVRQQMGQVLGEERTVAMADLRQSVVRVLGDREEIPVADLIGQRRELQRIAYQETKALDPKMRVELLRQVSREWGDLEVRALDAASKGEGELAGQKLRDLNKDYQRLKIAENALELNVSRHMTNRNFGLSEYMVGLGPAAHALVAGHPIGALGGVAAAYGHRALREHGNVFAALMLDRLSTLGGVSKAVAEHDAQIDRSIESLFTRRSATKKLGRAFHTDASPRRYEEEKERVTQMAAAAPAYLAAHYEEHARPVATHAPGVAKAMQDHAMTAAKFLSGKLPAPANSNALAPQLDHDHVFSEDRVRFLRYIDAVEDGPPGVMQRLAKGRMTPEDVETMGALYPESLREIRAKVGDRIADAQHPLDYQRRIQLGTLLGMDADATLEQPFIAAMQGSYTMHPSAPASQGSGSRGPAHLAAEKDSATAFQGTEAASAA